VAVLQELTVNVRATELVGEKEGETDKLVDKELTRLCEVIGVHVCVIVFRGELDDDTVKDGESVAVTHFEVVAELVLERLGLEVTERERVGVTVKEGRVEGVS